MTNHGYALTLAATAIDFPLEASERDTLESHLRECQACRAELEGFQADAATIAALPAIAPPPWVRRSIGKRRQTNRFVLLAAAALLVTASAALAFVVGSALNDRRTAVVPSSTSTPNPSSSPAVLDPTSARWTLLGTAPGGELIGFDGGYVVLGSRGDLEEPVAAFSRDGRGWEVNSLANSVPNCPGYGGPGIVNVPDADAVAIASNGHQLVVVGAEQPHDVASCADVGASIRPIAWVSDDGRTWRRSAPFYAAGPNGRATAVWAVPHGWQAVADDPSSGTLSVWESADGTQWEPVGPLAADPSEAVDVLAVGTASNGTVVLSRNAGVGPARLFVSSDDKTWTPIRSAAGCETGTTQIVGPAAQGLGGWVLLSGSRICTSVNLVDWSTTALPMAVTRIVRTRFGAIAVGDTCSGIGKTCLDPGPEAYLTIDGSHWSLLAHPKVYFGRSIADGPAGVLLIGSGPDAGGSLVSGTWSLAP